MLFYESGERRVVNFVNQTLIERPFSDFFFDNSTLCDGNDNYNTLAINIDHSSAFVDIDGDCQNDLIIHSTYFYYDTSLNQTMKKSLLEIWRGSFKDSKVQYCLTKSSVYDLTDDLGPFTIDDFDRDGLLDIIFPILNTGNVLIAHNKMKLTYDWSLDYCASHANLNLTNIPIVFDAFSEGQVI